MTRTVDDLRDEIRVAVGRHERVESTAFTKEALAAICDALGSDVEGTSLPPKSRMRAEIHSQADRRDGDGPERGDRPFRKADLEAIARALDAEE